MSILLVGLFLSSVSRLSNPVPKDPSAYMFSTNAFQILQVSEPAIICMSLDVSLLFAYARQTASDVDSLSWRVPELFVPQTPPLNAPITQDAIVLDTASGALASREGFSSMMRLTM